MDKKITCEYGYDEMINALLSNPIAPNYYWIIGIIEFIFGLFTLIKYGYDDVNKWLGILLIVISILIFLMLLMNIPDVRKKLYYEKSKEANKIFKNGVKYEFIFKDDTIKATSFIDNNESTKKYYYKDLKQLSIGKDYIYIFIDKKMVYIIKRETLNNEEINNLIKIFKDNKVKVLKQK